MDPEAKPVPMVDPVHRFVLFTNGKCGGTTLKTWFFANLDLAGLERRPLALVRAFGPNYAWRHYRAGRRILPRGAQLHEVEAIRRFTNFYRRAYCTPALARDAARGFYAFAVVRHPEDRVVSGYVDKICGEDRDEPWVRNVVSRGGGSISFNEFLDYLEFVDEAACDPHWRRQTYIFGDRRMDAFVRLEHLAEDFRKIARGVGEAGGVFDHKRQSNRYDPALTAAAMAADAPSMSSDQVIAWAAEHGAFPPKEAFLTEPVRARIRRIYARDFDLLPYD